MSKRLIHVEKFGSAVYATPTGFKLSSRGHVLPPSAVYSSLSKGEARKLRKASRAAGLPCHASAPRS